MQHTYEEVVMGHKLWFPDSLESDVISATANSEGFTPLTAIARCYGWDINTIESASQQCNRHRQVAVIQEVKPKLLLVPSTKGDGPTDFLIRDLIQAANAIECDVLNFTHYGFVQKNLPPEVPLILQVMLDRNTTTSIRVVVWDIDSRVKDEMLHIWNKLRKLSN